MSIPLTYSSACFTYTSVQPNYGCEFAYVLYGWRAVMCHQHGNELFSFDCFFPSGLYISIFIRIKIRVNIDWF